MISWYDTKGTGNKIKKDTRILKNLILFIRGQYPQSKKALKSGEDSPTFIPAES